MPIFIINNELKNKQEVRRKRYDTELNIILYDFKLFFYIQTQRICHFVKLRLIHWHYVCASAFFGILNQLTRN